MSTKPIVFFSHSSADRELLVELRRSFLEKTGEAVSVFLSSDGQSIPLGRNWVRRIEAALESAGLMVVFLSHRSLASSWVHFEAGFAYAKGVRVVPVALPGVDMSDVAPPMGLLQGFNIRSADGLNNLIALVNEEFEHKHALAFSDEDFGRLMTVGPGSPDPSVSMLADLAEEILLETSCESLKAPPQIEEAWREVCGSGGLEYRWTRRDRSLQRFSFDLVGISVGVTSVEPPAVQFQIAPGMVREALPIAQQFMDAAVGQGQVEVGGWVNFREGVGCEVTSHRASAMVRGTEISLGKAGAFRLGALEFTLSHPRVSRRGVGPPSMALAPGPVVPSADDIVRAVEILVRRRVVFWEVPGWDVGPVR